MLTASSSERRRRLVRRGVPAVLVLAAVALGAGVLVASLRESGAERVAREYTTAWQRSDHARMYALLTPAARRAITPAAFAKAYRDARDTATATDLRPDGKPRGHGDSASVPIVVTTRAFGTLRSSITLPVSNDDRVAWQPSLVFPGLRPGETLNRTTTVPPRARILARDGKALVVGSAAARTSPLGAAGAEIAGRMGPAEDDATADALYARGFPRAGPTGLTGLERILEREVAGVPGGTLRAGQRTLAQTTPRPARPVRTTIDVAVQQAAVTALAGRVGGVAALDARTAEVRGLAGIAFSAGQPPGSTFKIVTATAALEERLVKPSSSFPVETKAVIDGVDLENANGESCGGTFANSFAESCNSVFAPLGVKLGAKRLVTMAERYGFNSAPAIPGAVASTLPQAAEITSPLELGATAIGQGKVLATPLEMASIAQTVASEGARREPVLLAGEPSRRVRVSSRAVARTLEQLMIGVVAHGTGVQASLEPVKVAGKTGTAELEDTTQQNKDALGVQAKPPGSDTDAWFTAYAPVRRPRIAVAVLLVRNGAGGDTAAPAARGVLQAGLTARR